MLSCCLYEDILRGTNPAADLPQFPSSSNTWLSTPAPRGSFPSPKCMNVRLVFSYMLSTQFCKINWRKQKQTKNPSTKQLSSHGRFKWRAPTSTQRRPASASVPWNDTLFRLLWEGGTLSRNKFSGWYSLLWKSWILEGMGGSINGKRLPRLVWIWTKLTAMGGQGRRKHGEMSSWETASRTSAAYNIWSDSLRPASSYVRNYLHQAILLHGYSASKRQSCNGPLGLKGPRLWKWGKPDMRAGNRLESLLSINTRAGAH